MPDPVIFGNILGGVSYTYPPHLVPPLYAADCQNMLPILNGYAAKRKGTAKLNTTAYGSSLITTFHELIVGSTSYKFASQGTVVGLLGADLSFSDIMTNMVSPYGQWVNYGSYAIYANGVNNVKRTTGLATADLTADLSGIPGGKCLAEWGERVWVGGYTDNVATLLGSDLRAPTLFSSVDASAGFFTGTVGSTNQPITALTPFFDILLIGKLNQIYQLTGAPETDLSSFRLTPLQTKDKDSMGFTAKNAIVQVGNDLVFLDGFFIKAMSGIQEYGDVESINIIGNIKDFFQAPDGAGLDKDLLQYSDFFHYKKAEQIYCTIPTGTSTRYWFVIDYSNQDMRKNLGLPKYSFFPMGGFTPICFAGIENGSSMDIYAGCSDGYVRQMDTGYNDDGTAIDAHATWCYGDRVRYIQPVSLQLKVRKPTSTLTLQPYYAMGLQEWQEIIDSSNFTAMDTETVGDNSWVVNKGMNHKMISSFYMNTDATFALKIRHSTMNETFEIRDSALRFRLKQRYLK